MSGLGVRVGQPGFGVHGLWVTVGGFTGNGETEYNDDDDEAEGQGIAQGPTDVQRPHHRRRGLEDKEPIHPVATRSTSE